MKKQTKTQLLTKKSNVKIKIKTKQTTTSTYIETTFKNKSNYSTTAIAKLADLIINRIINGIKNETYILN